MLSRSLTLGLTLFVGTLSGCENQGLGTRADAIEQICAYNTEAIQQLGCKSHTAETGDPDADAKVEPTDQSEFFRLTCLNQHRIVAPRCSTQQIALAKCMVDLFKPLTDPAVRTAEFKKLFECEIKDVAQTGAKKNEDGTTPTLPKENGNAILTAVSLEPKRRELQDFITALETCSNNPPSYAP